MRNSASESRGESLGLLAFPARQPVLTLLLCLIATAFLATRAIRIRGDAAPSTLVPMGNARALDAGIELDASVVVGVFADDVFAPATLAKIDALSRSLAELRGVATVIGPTTLPEVRRRKGGDLQTRPIVRKLPANDADAQKIRQRVLAHPLSGTVVARDGRAAAITLRADARAYDREGLAVLEEGVRQVVAKLGGPETFALGGLPVLANAAGRELERELPRLVAAALAVVAVAALICLRSAGGALLTCATVAVAALWTLGLAQLFGSRIGFATILVPPLVILFGSAPPMVLLTRCGWERRSGGSPVASLIATVAHTRLSLAVGALAAAVGAGSLAFGTIPALRSFGWWGVLAAATSLLATITLALPLVALWPAAFVRTPAASTSHASRRLESLGDWIGRRRMLVFLLVAPILAAAVWGAVRVRSGAVQEAYFDLGSPLRREEKRIADAIAPPTAVTISVRGYEPRTFARRDVLTALRDLQVFLGKQPGVVATRSLLDYLALAHAARAPDTPFELPETQEEIDALLKVDPAALADVASSELTRTRIIVYTNEGEPRAVGHLVDGVAEFVSPKLLPRGFGSRALFPRGIEVQPQGTLAALYVGSRALVDELTRALTAAALLLLLLSTLLFLSTRVGAAAVLLNLVAPLAFLAVAGWMRLPLTVSSACLVPLALGIAVGHTLHYLSACAVVAERRSETTEPADVVGVVGRPIAYAAIALVLGCLTWLASQVPALRAASLLGAVAFAAALAANVVVLATRLLATRILTLSDLLLTRIGPPEDIALFAGLRPFQTKIVMLTGRLAIAAPGDFITRRGEVKQELYVLLDGHADVRASENGPTLGTLARGEVIGEMGLVREQPRSADVVATEPTEYLILDGGFLDRLRRQYPRIAAIMFLNLSRILSDRLERTTARLAERKI